MVAADRDIESHGLALLDHRRVGTKPRASHVDELLALSSQMSGHDCGQLARN